MKRLGMYSGHVYSEDEVADMQECGRFISDAEANNFDAIFARHMNDLLECAKCGFSCPKAQEDII